MEIKVFEKRGKYKPEHEADLPTRHHFILLTHLDTHDEHILMNPNVDISRYDVLLFLVPLFYMSKSPDHEAISQLTQ